MTLPVSSHQKLFTMMLRQGWTEGKGSASRQLLSQMRCLCEYGKYWICKIFQGWTCDRRHKSTSQESLHVGHSCTLATNELHPDSIRNCRDPYKWSGCQFFCYLPPDSRIIILANCFNWKRPSSSRKRIKCWARVNDFLHRCLRGVESYIHMYPLLVWLFALEIWTLVCDMSYSLNADIATCSLAACSVTYQMTIRDNKSKHIGSTYAKYEVIQEVGECLWHECAVRRFLPSWEYNGVHDEDEGESWVASRESIPLSIPWICLTAVVSRNIRKE